MSEVFAPEEIRVYEPGVERKYGDMWMVVRDQLRIDLTEVLRVKPDATIKPKDITGYYYTQHGVGPIIVDEVIDLALAGGDENDHDGPALSNLLKSHITTPLPARRIRFGAKGLGGEPVLSPRVNNIFDLVVELGHTYKMNTLYPKPGTELTYRGRTNVNLGRIVINQISQDMSVYTDVLESVNQESGTKHTVLVSSTNQGVFPTARSVDIV